MKTYSKISEWLIVAAVIASILISDIPMWAGGIILIIAINAVVCTILNVIHTIRNKGKQITKARLLYERTKAEHDLHLELPSISSGPFTAWAMENVNRITKARKKIDTIDQELLVMDAKEIINPPSHGQ